MEKDLGTLDRMEQDAIALEKQGKLREAKQLLSEVLAAHLEDQSGKKKILQVMTAGNLARVMSRLYPTRDALPAPSTPDYKALSEQIKIIRQIVESSDTVEKTTFENLVNLDAFNGLIKMAADKKWDEAERVTKTLLALHDETKGKVTVRVQQKGKEDVKSGLSLNKLATFAIDDSRVIDEARRLADQSGKVLIVIGATGREIEIYSIVEPTKSGNCFIATAAYGSPLAPEVEIFRRFRDGVLLVSSLGKRFVGLYYFVSPPLASLISKHKCLQTLTRRFLLEPILHLITGRGK